MIRLPTSITIDEVTSELGDGISGARRITRRQNGESVPTMVVILDFPPGTELPARVILYHTLYRIKPYIPRPVACNNCQRFGHVAEHCRQDIRCPHCAGPHGHDECQAAEKKCANCGSAHSARFRGCQKYAERLKVTTVMVRQGLTYRDAVNNVRTVPVQAAKPPVKKMAATTAVTAATVATATTTQQPTLSTQPEQQEGAKKKRRPRRSKAGAARSLAPVLDEVAVTPAVNRKPAPQTSTPAPMKKLTAMASSTQEALEYQSEVADLSRQALITKLTIVQIGLNMMISLVVRLCQDSPKSDWSSELHEHLANLLNLVSSDDDA